MDELSAREPHQPGDPVTSDSHEQPMGEVLSSDAAASVGVQGDGKPGRRRRVGPMLLSGGTVAAVLVAAGFIVGPHLFSARDAEAAKWVPANALFYGELNLDPSASQQNSALAFEQVFPGAPKPANGTDLKDTLLAAAFRNNKAVSYDADIKPWLGSHVAVAAFIDGSGRPQSVFLLQSTNDAKAKVALQKLAKGGHFGLGSGFASSSSSSVGGPVPAASFSTLPMPSGAPFAVASAMPMAVASAAASAPAPYSGSIAPMLVKGSLMPTSSAYQSTLSMTYDTPHAAGYAVQDGFAVLGASQAIVDAAVASARSADLAGKSEFNHDLAGLPSDRLGTMWWDETATLKLLGNKSPQLKRLFAAEATSGVVNPTAAGRAAFALTVEPKAVQVSGQLFDAKDATTLHNGDAGHLLGQLPAKTLAGIGISNPKPIIDSGLTQLRAAGGAAVAQSIDAMSKNLDIKVPADIETLLGTGIAAGIGLNPGDLQHPIIQILTQPSDPGTALPTAKKLAALAALRGVSMTATASGSQISLLAGKPGTGHLADDPDFKSALAGMPDQTLEAGYVSFGGYFGLMFAMPGVQAGGGPAMPVWMQHLGGIGFWAHANGDTPTLTLRFTLK